MLRKWILGSLMAAALVLLAALPASAVLIAARVNISTISPCPSFCGGSGGSSDFSFDGGGGVATASDSLSNSDGDGSGVVSVGSSSLLPDVGAQAFSNSNSRVAASATGQRAYDYVGTAPTSISLDLSFEGEAGAPASNDAVARASVAVILGNDLEFITDFATLLFEIVDLDPGLTELGSDVVSIPVNGGFQIVNTSIPIDLDPGDRIFIWAQALTTGTRSGFGDALNTLTLQFSDPSNLMPVPEPTTGVLLLGGLLALGSRRVRSR